MFVFTVIKFIYEYILLNNRFDIKTTAGYNSTRAYSKSPLCECNKSFVSKHILNVKI